MSKSKEWVGASAERQLELLPEIVEAYVVARELCVKQQARLRAHAREFNEWIRTQREGLAGESCSAVISAWIRHLAPQHDPSTVNNHRQSVISLLRFATPDGAPLPRADRVRRQKEPDKLRLAFTHDELRLLIQAAPNYKPITVRTFGRGIKGDKKIRNRPDGIPWSRWWEAFVRVGYDSGQYLSDLRLIPWSNVGRDGAVTFIRHKTGKTMSFRLGPAAIKSARALKHATLLLPWDFDMAAYFAREFKKFVATVPGVRVLGPKSLRRSALTYTYMAHGEEAARVLAGHSSFTTTAKHYIDWSIARRPIVSPPELYQSQPRPRHWNRVAPSERRAALLAACDKMPGRLGSIAADIWWRALVLVELDSRAKGTELLAMKWAHFDRTAGELRHPVDLAVSFRLSAPTVAALEAIELPTRELIFEWPWHPNTFYKFRNKLLRLAGLQRDKRRSSPSLEVA